MPTNFELERLKPKLDIFKIPENRVHELTDSNVSRRKIGHVRQFFANCAKTTRRMTSILAASEPASKNTSEYVGLIVNGGKEPKLKNDKNS